MNVISEWTSCVQKDLSGAHALVKDIAVAVTDDHFVQKGVMMRLEERMEQRGTNEPTTSLSFVRLAGHLHLNRWHVFVRY